MFRFFVLALCVGLGALRGLGANATFVTAGVPPGTITPVLSSGSIWNNAPVGQEFVATLPVLDFVTVYFASKTNAHYEIVLHEQTITGPVVAVSERIQRLHLGLDFGVFNFAPQLALLPGATYVLEFVQVETPTSALDAATVYRWQDVYDGGRLIWQGNPQDRYDLYFSAGVVVPSLLSSNLDLFIPQTADGVPRLVDPNAAFGNFYLTNFDGALLEWEINSFYDSISLSNGGNSEIVITPATGDIFLAGEVVPFGKLLANEPGSNTFIVFGHSRVSVQLNAQADADAVGALLRSLTYTASVRPVIAPHIRIFPPFEFPTLRVTFSHPLGYTTESRWVNVSHPYVNIPPPSRIFVRGSGSFLSSTSAYIIRRLETTITGYFDVGGFTDAGGDVLTFAWRDGTNETLLSTQARLTNAYPVGTHLVNATISDGEQTVEASAGFEVITPLEAMVRLRAEIGEIIDPKSKERLDAPLRAAERSFQASNWRISAQHLRIFVRRLDRRIFVQGGRWRNATEEIESAVRNVPISPPPLFHNPIPLPGTGSGSAGSSSVIFY